MVEDYIGTPYPFDKYYLVIMPAAYPFGGMANPWLNFVSSSTLVGDRSQINVVINNMAQSWFGVQVGFSNWSDLYLNAGFSTMVERQVLAILNGQDYMFSGAFIGNYSMCNAISNFNMTGNNPSYGSIHPVYFGQNPDYGFSVVQYEKGYQMMQWLSNYLGSDMYRNFLQYYINNNSFMSITSIDMQRSFATWIQGLNNLTGQQ